MSGARPLTLTLSPGGRGERRDCRAAARVVPAGASGGSIFEEKKRGAA